MTFERQTWAKFRVCKRADVPVNAHYQTIVFGKREEFLPFGIDDKHPYPVPTVDVYCFMTKEQLDEFIAHAMMVGMDFVFYAVPGGLGRAAIKVEV